MSVVGPCIFPGCDDGHGNPTLTRHTMCGACRSRYRRTLDWLALDYTTIRVSMARPVSRNRMLVAVSRTYGHPAEWASDTARSLAEFFFWWEDDLRGHLGDPPPTRPYPGMFEPRLVAHSHRYLANHFEQLVGYDPDRAARDICAEIVDWHSRMRSMLGHTRYVEKLPGACPWCDVHALTRSTGVVTCGDCGKTVDEVHYAWLVRYTLDQAIDEYDKAHDTPVTAVAADAV